MQSLLSTSINWAKPWNNFRADYFGVSMMPQQKTAQQIKTRLSNSKSSESFKR